jgi:hypothetical protein
MKRRPEVQLDRILAALERELIEADHEELMGVVADLGLKPSMKGSVALFGVISQLNWPKPASGPLPREEQRPSEQSADPAKETPFSND